GEGSKTNAAAAVDHARGFVDGFRCAGTFDDVVDALTAVQLAHRFDRIFFPGIDDKISAQFLADLKAVVARAGEDYRMGAERLRDRHAEQSDRTGARHHDALARD